MNDPFDDLTRTQMWACVTLAKILAGEKLRPMVLYEPGDAPSVQTAAAPGIEICADGTGNYDIWTTGKGKMKPLKMNLTLDQAAAALRGAKLAS